MKNRISGKIELIKRVATRKGRAQLGCFSLEGCRHHQRALNAGIHPRFTLISHQLANQPTELVDDLQAVCPIIPIPDAEMTQLTGGRGLGEIVSLVEMPASPNLPTLLQQQPSPLLLVGVDLVDPGNVGALIRTAHGLGATTFVTIGQADPYHPKAVRTSMGSLFKLPVAHFDEVTPLLDICTTAGIQTIAAITQTSTPLHQLTIQQHAGVALFMGSEYWGLPDKIADQLDSKVMIPMPAGIDSLSVNAAGAILLYQLSQMLG